LPVVLGIGVFVLGVMALNHLLKPVRIADVFAQVRATEPATLIAATAATTAGYIALIGYDWSALRYLGKKLPFRIVALGGFLGYSFGNTVGISILSGGAVRYRIYSGIGLTALEVASVSTFVALAFGFGITVVGLGALAIHPSALGDALPFSSNAIRMWSVVGALGILGVFAWLSLGGKTLRLRGREISAPSLGILLGQLAVTLADVALAALTLYVLLPGGAPDFLTFVAIFAAAAMAGVLSHVPGGVGVFESVVIAAMPANVALDELAAALLLYRIIYFLVPFALALAIVALNEARLAGGLIARVIGEGSDPMKSIVRATRATAPLLVGVTTFAVGLYLLVIALFPSVQPSGLDPNDLLSAILVDGGTRVAVAFAVLLLCLSFGLARRIAVAFWLTEAVLVGGAAILVWAGFDLDSAALLLVTAVVLGPLKRAFAR